MKIIILMLAILVCGLATADAAGDRNTPAVREGVDRLSKKGIGVSFAPGSAVLPVTHVLLFLRHNTINQPAAADDLRWLTSLKSLTTLRVTYCDTIDESGMAVLGSLVRLEILEVKSKNFADESLKHFRGLTNLHTFKLLAPNLDGTGLKHLASLKKLKHLTLQRNPKITGKNAQALALLDSVEFLDLSSTGVNGVGLVAIAKMKNLKSLYLGHCGIRDAGLKSLARSKTLETLDVRHGQVTDTGLKELSKFPKLRRLRLMKTRISDIGLRSLAGCKRLEVLSLRGTDIGDEGIEHLLGHLKLNVLILRETKIGNRTMERLSDFPALRTLDVDSTRVTDEGIEEILALPLITTFIATRTKTTPRMLSELRRGRRKLRLNGSGNQLFEKPYR